MGKKRRSQREEAAEEPLGENWTNPFAGLNIKVEEPPPPPPPPPPSKEELARRSLSLEDQELLKAFGGETSEAPELGRADMRKHVERISLSKERKGHGGKTVTLVRGLENMDTMAQMELCAEIKTHLGIGGRFSDGVLELQGDQIARAGQWFRDHHYQVK